MIAQKEKAMQLQIECTDELRQNNLIKDAIVHNLRIHNKLLLMAYNKYITDMGIEFLETDEGMVFNFFKSIYFKTLVESTNRKYQKDENK